MPVWARGLFVIPAAATPGWGQPGGLILSAAPRGPVVAAGSAEAVAPGVGAASASAGWPRIPGQL